MLNFQFFYFFLNNYTSFLMIFVSFIDIILLWFYESIHLIKQKSYFIHFFMQFNNLIMTILNNFKIQSRS